MRNNDPVYKMKHQLIEESGIVIYRFHDGIHRNQPDGITKGMIQSLEWEPYVDEYQSMATILEIPPLTLKELTRYVKNSLGLPLIRIVGDLSAKCKRIGILVGYQGGGDSVNPLCEKEKLDVSIAGEGPEWETPEYVRDAVDQGRRKALMVVGHA